MLLTGVAVATVPWCHYFIDYLLQFTWIWFLEFWVGLAVALVYDLASEEEEA